MQKERRHEYETVWVDGEGNELDEPPDEASAARESRNGAKPKVKAAQQRGGRAGRIPPPPSWRRAGKRSAILGVVIFVFIFAVTKSGSSSHRLEKALLTAVLYTALFVPFTFMIDRFSYNRWQRRAEAQGEKQPRKR